jgi:hypothetical protein
MNSQDPHQKRDVSRCDSPAPPNPGFNPEKNWGDQHLKAPVTASSLARHPESLRVAIADLSLAELARI